MDVNDIVAVVNNQKAAALSLSKGGWEGWLQCELWYYLNVTKQPAESTEREVKYPNNPQYCDLVSGNQWIELKAFGEFREGDEQRFMDSVAQDVHKLGNIPHGANGFAAVVVTKSIGDAVRQAFINRGWHGFTRTDAEYVSIFSLTTHA